MQEDGFLLVEIIEEIALLYCLPADLVRHSNAVWSCSFIKACRSDEVLRSTVFCNGNSFCSRICIRRYSSAPLFGNWELMR